MVAQPESKKSARLTRRRDEQLRLGLITEGEPEIPGDGSYSSYHHGTPRFILHRAEDLAIRAAHVYVKRRAEGDADRTRTARGILRGQAQMLLLMKSPTLYDQKPLLAQLEQQLIEQAEQ